MEPTDKERGARLSQLIGDGMDAAWEEGHKRGVRDTETRIAALVRPVVEEMRAWYLHPNEPHRMDWPTRIEKAIAGEGRDE